MQKWDNIIDLIFDTDSNIHDNLKYFKNIYFLMKKKDVIKNKISFSNRRADVLWFRWIFFWISSLRLIFEYFKYILKSIFVQYFWLNLLSRKNNLRNFEFVLKLMRREKYENENFSFRVIKKIEVWFDIFKCLTYANFVLLYCNSIFFIILIWK